ISEETMDDGKLLITIEGMSPPYYAEYAANKPFLFRYTVEPETLLIESFDGYIIGDDGSETLYLHCDCDYNMTIDLDLPDIYSQFENAAEKREIRVIMNPGTDSQAEYTFEAPIDKVLQIAVPNGYNVYDDEACTIISQQPERDENGNFPETITFYVAPIAG
ncbi:MAG: hypothetical protein Q4D04_14335, partial [Clostridia bacterium]|nr:hypothetical protein [Clostridia bacterium]